MHRPARGLLNVLARSRFRVRSAETRLLEKGVPALRRADAGALATEWTRRDRLELERSALTRHGRTSAQVRPGAGEQLRPMTHWPAVHRIARQSCSVRHDVCVMEHLPMLQVCWGQSPSTRHPQRPLEHGGRQNPISHVPPFAHAEPAPQASVGFGGHGLVAEQANVVVTETSSQA
jgi:hypothetical protein